MLAVAGLSQALGVELSQAGSLIQQQQQQSFFLPDDDLVKLEQNGSSDIPFENVNRVNVNCNRR